MFEALLPVGTRRDIPGFQIAQQERTQWCWAAVAQALLAHYGAGAPRQCEVAGRFYGTDCCNDRGRTDRPEDPAHVFSRMGLLARAPTPGEDPPQAIVGDVDAARPPCILITGAGMGHIVAVSGYAQGYDNRFYLIVADPADPSGDNSACTEPFTYRGMNWSATYFTRAPH